MRIQQRGRRSLVALVRCAEERSLHRQKVLSYKPRNLYGVGIGRLFSHVTARAV